MNSSFCCRKSWSKKIGKTAKGIETKAKIVPLTKMIFLLNENKIVKNSELKKSYNTDRKSAENNLNPNKFKHRGTIIGKTVKELVAVVHPDKDEKNIKIIQNDVYFKLM